MSGQQPLGPPRQITRDGVLAEVAYMREQGRAIIGRRNQPPPIILVVCERHPVDETPLGLENCVVPVMHQPHMPVSPATRNDMVTCARAVALAGNAFAAVTIADTWLVLARDVPGGVIDPSKLKLDGNASNHDNRRHALLTIVQWKDGTMSFFCDAYTHDQGLTDWEDLSAEFQQVNGISDFDPVICEVPDPVPPEIAESCRQIARHLIWENQDRMAASARSMATSRGGDA